MLGHIGVGKSGKIFACTKLDTESNYEMINEIADYAAAYIEKRTAAEEI